ncbi:hypothetical protein Q8A67_021907 [Cirrhinus molitorella]|uniref:Uncharacterized protein n=1 Tax=Cirrhinus molitorella TaxID=172907 RepID=A0AA88P4E7_9TELE|nr:hypothetical protein Q8A67_021907 [Cirrhinus molitorella]
MTIRGAESAFGGGQDDRGERIGAGACQDERVMFWCQRSVRGGWTQQHPEIRACHQLNSAVCCCVSERRTVSRSRCGCDAHCGLKVREMFRDPPVLSSNSSSSAMMEILDLLNNTHMCAEDDDEKTHV